MLMHISKQSKWITPLNRESNHLPLSQENLLGQKMGYKGRVTREKILVATHKLLRTTAYKNLTASTISQSAGVSAATFYVYFSDLKELFFACVLEAVSDTDNIFHALKQPWNTADSEVAIENFVNEYMAHWSQYRPEMHMLLIESDLGSPPFINLRVSISTRIVRAIADQLHALKPDLSNSDMLARVIFTAMERLASLDQALFLHHTDEDMRDDVRTLTAENIKRSIVDVIGLTTR
jgi:AcrR family transcriptional regulator